MHVLITGAAGYVGRHLARVLSAEHTLRLGDIAAEAAGSLPGEFVPLDVTNPEQAHAAMTGIDAVVHLAIASGHEGDVEDDAFNQTRFDVNVKGTYNILEAARRAGVRRVVFTSSIMVVWGYPPPEWVPAAAVPRPVGTYAYTKYLGECLCERYARDHGLSIVCLRIPKPIDLFDPRWQGRSLRPQWLPFPDLCRAYALALTAPDIGFEIITVVAESPQRRWDISKAERLLGWNPEIDVTKLGFVLGDEHEPF
jgi:uronate dehydrogenase